MSLEIPPDKKPLPAGPTIGGPRAPILRQVFLVLGGIIVVSGLVLGFILASLRSQTLVAGVRLTESFAQVLAEETTRTFQTVDQQLEIVGGRSELKPGSEVGAEAGRDLLRAQILELPFVRALAIVDSSGRVTHTTEDVSPGDNVAEREYFQKQRDSQGGFQIGPPVRGRVHGEWLLSATRPRPRGAKGAFSGLLVAAVEPHYFEKLWQVIDVGQGGSIALFDRKGTLMVRSPADDAALGKVFSSLPLLTMPLDTKPTGHFLNRSVFDGTYRLFAYTVLPEHPDLIVVVGQSYDFVLSPWWQIARLTISMWAISGIVIVGLGLSLTRADRQRAKVEAQVQELAQRLTLATDAASIGVWDSDLKSDLWSATPTCFTMLGYDADEARMSRQRWLDYLHPEDLPTMTALLRSAIAGAGSLHQGEVRLKHKDGSFRWMRVVGRVIERDQSEQAVRLLGVVVDITEGKRAEAALRASEAFSLSILDSVGAEIAVLDNNGNILAVNEPWKRFARENARERGEPVPRTGVGSSYLEACRPTGDAACPENDADDLRAVREGIRGVLDHRLEVYSMEYACPPPGGEPRWFSMSVTPLRGGPGAVVAHIDITARKLAESTLQKAMAEKEGLLKEIHHRVKNNMQVITSLLRLETGRNREPATRAVLQDMQGRIRSMALLHETLYRTREFGRVDLANYFRQLTTQLLRAQNTTPASVRLTLDLSTVHLEIDRAIPCGLIVNELVSNSLKHAFPQGGTGEVRLSLQKTNDGNVVIQVSDSGPGLAPDFESRRDQSLGLQLVGDLARQLGGRFNVGPLPQAVFTVTFDEAGAHRGSRHPPGSAEA